MISRLHLSLTSPICQLRVCLRRVPQFPFAEGWWYRAPHEGIISQELYHIALFQKHLQVLVGCLGSRVPVKGGHIVVHHQDDFLSLAALLALNGLGFPVLTHCFLNSSAHSPSAFHCFPPGSVSGRFRLHLYRWKRPSKWITLERGWYTTLYPAFSPQKPGPNPRSKPGQTAGQIRQSASTGPCSEGWLPLIYSLHPLHNYIPPCPDHPDGRSSSRNHRSR